MSTIRSPIAYGVITSLIALGHTDLALTQQVVTNSETEIDQQQEALESSSDLNPRQLRRSERRRLRETEDSEEPLVSTGQTETASDNRSEAEIIIVVEVEPEMKCRREAVTGSRVSREICTPVASLEATERQEEENAQEFLRRTRELSTVIPEDQRNNPFLTPSAFD